MWQFIRDFYIFILDFEFNPLNSSMKYTRFLFVLFIALHFCQPCLTRSLEEIRRSGKLFVGMSEDDFHNINYPLAVEFAKYLNVEFIPVKMEWEDAFRKGGIIPEGLETDPSVAYTPDIFQKVDIICSTFTIVEWRKKLFDFAETLMSAELILISRQVVSPRNYSELKGLKLAFQKETSFESHIKAINKQIGGGIEMVVTRSGEEAKNMLLERRTDGIILDADEALKFSSDNPNRFRIALPVSKVSKTAFAVEKANLLKNEVENFFQTLATSGVLDDIFFNTFGLTYSSYVSLISRTTTLQVYHRDLDEIIRSKKLVVALRDRDFIYKESGQKQFMHALAEEFADHLGVKLEYVITPTFSRYWENEKGIIVKDSIYTPDWFNYFDVACEVIAPLPWRENKVNLVGVYPTEYAVIAKKDVRISSIDDLKKLKGVTARGTVYEDMMQKNGITGIYYVENVDDFVKEVDAGKADYTIIYNAFLELTRYPDLEVKLSLGEFNVSWAVRKDQPLLQEELGRFIRASREKGLIRILLKAISGASVQASSDYMSSYYQRFQAGQLPSVLYGAEDGLPQEDVFSIFQDSRGYMWFGTNSGVVRYNGREMNLLDEQDGLLDNTVLDIDQDSSGVIYFATSRGIAVYFNDSVQHHLFPNSSFRSIFIDKDNNRWFIGEDGLYLLDKNNLEIFLNPMFPDLPANIYSIDRDRNSDDVYIASSEGIYHLSLGERVLNKVAANGCYSLYIDFNDSIWLGMGGGLYISSLADLRSGSLLNTSRWLSKTLDIPNTIIKNITQNQFGSIWLVTDSEILQVLSSDQKAIKYEKEIGLKNNKILSFWVDQEDNIWIGFSGGLQRLSNKKGLRNFYPNTINSFICSVHEDRQKRLWIGSNNGVYYFREKLENFTPMLPSGTDRFVTALLPNGNILIVSTVAMYEIHVKSLGIVRQVKFKQMLPALENVFVSSRGEIFLLTGIQGTIYYLKNISSQPVIHKNKNTSAVFQMIEYEGKIIGGSKDRLVVFSNGEFETMATLGSNIWCLCYNDDKLWVGTDSGLGIYEQETFTPVNQGISTGMMVVKSICPAKNKNYLWLGTSNGFSYFDKERKQEEFIINSKDGLLGDEITVNGLFVDSNDLLWIGTYHGISNFNIRAKSQQAYAPLCYIEKVSLNGSSIDYRKRNEFRHFENNLVIELSALSYSDEKSIEYEFYLRGFENEYSSYSKGNEYKAYYSNLPAGKYEFVYKAKGKNNVWSYAQKYEFSIRKAWYNTFLFRLGLVLLIISAVWAFYTIRVRAIEMEKKKLDALVKERTRELEAANTEIEAQRDLAEEQRDKISQQKKEITDSILYAQRIQKSLLPSQTVLRQIMPDHFVLFLPRDIVSGDFYWARQVKDRLIISAVDCTGHGVPGAFMSMLGIAYLNEIVNKYETLHANDILNHLRREIIVALRQKGEGEAKDGMDMALCIIDPASHTIEFSGANNPMYLIHDNSLTELKGDKMPVAIHDHMDPFTLHNISYQTGDIIYLFSDGYADQFGGTDGKKFMYKALKDLLLKIHTHPMKEQAKLLDQALCDWKNGFDQIDDILVLGVKL